MKKNKTKDQEQNRKRRHPSLRRETIRALDPPALLEFAKGGTERLPSTTANIFCCRTTSSNEGG